MGTTTENVLLDINPTSHALGGSHCSEAACRAGVRYCGATNRCRKVTNLGNRGWHGRLDNGLGPIETIGDLADVTFYGHGDHVNHALAALATVARQVESGEATFHVSDYQETRMVEVLMEVDDFTAEEALAVRRMHDLAVIRSGGLNIADTDAKAAATAFIKGLTSQDREFFFAKRIPRQTPTGIEHVSLIDYNDDAVLIGAMLCIDGPVTLVTGDRGLLQAGSRLAAMYDQFYIVTPEIYANAAKYALVRTNYDALRAA